MKNKKYYMVIKGGIVISDNLPDYLVIDLDGLEVGQCPCCGDDSIHIDTSECSNSGCVWNEIKDNHI
jgi:hypothetical protein